METHGIRSLMTSYEGVAGRSDGGVSETSLGGQAGISCTARGILGEERK